MEARTLRALCASSALLAAAPAAMAQWWWPPTEGMQVLPECPSPSTQLRITLRGDWPHSCIPNIADLRMSGAEIDFNVVRDPPPGICLAVIRPWSLEGQIGPLPAGTYAVYATYYAGTTPSSSREFMGNIVVNPSCPGGCYANCDGSTVAPVLNVSDFICFQTKFAAGDPYANCDESTVQPALNVSDFICFQTKFATGCS
jgi:hypothetical protein